MFQFGIHQPEQDRVCHRADAGLQRHPVGRKAAGFFFLQQKAHDVAGNFFADGVCSRQGARLLLALAQDDGCDLLLRAAQNCASDALPHTGKRDRFAGRGILYTVYIVEALQFGGLAEVQLDNDCLRQVDPGLGTAQRRRRDDSSVLGDGRGLDERNVDRAVKAAARVLRKLAQMQVGIGDFVSGRAVYGGAQRFAGHVGGAARNDAEGRPLAVQLLAGRSAGKQRKLQASSAAAHLFGQRQRHRLGAAGRREAADGDGHAVFNQLRRILGAQELFLQRRAAKPVFRFHAFHPTGHDKAPFPHVCLLTALYHANRMYTMPLRDSPHGRTRRSERPRQREAWLMISAFEPNRT